MWFECWEIVKKFVIFDYDLIEDLYLVMISFKVCCGVVVEKYVYFFDEMFVDEND